jgi:hypothetical protein
MIDVSRRGMPRGGEIVDWAEKLTNRVHALHIVAVASENEHSVAQMGDRPKRSNTGVFYGTDGDDEVVLKTDAAVVFMSEAAAGSARDFPWWHGRVGDGITMTIDIRIGAPLKGRASEGKVQSKSAPMFFYANGRRLDDKNEAHSGGGSVAKAVADYPTSKLVRDPTSNDVCSWCLIGKPLDDGDVNAIFLSKSFSTVWNKKATMHSGCYVKRAHHAKSFPESYVPGDPCPLLVPVDDVPVESSDDESSDDADAAAVEEACDWDEAGSSDEEA